jgi:exosortase B
MANQVATVETKTNLAANSPDWVPWAIVGAGFLLLYVPVFYDLLHGVWRTPEEGHGPFILLIGAWLIWRRRADILAPPFRNAPITGWICLLLSLFIYVLGRSQDILTLEVGALPCLLLAVLLLLRGPAAVKPVGFALVFLLFMVPLPGAFVDAVTQPMARVVSDATEQLLLFLGYPIARSGVVLQLGPYQLLVAEACAGLRSLFALEAMGLLYLNLMHHRSLIRNLTLALLIAPIAIAANVVRVVSLALITYYLGDAAGQGFLHEFSGLVLYCTALALIIGADSLFLFLDRPPHSESAP